MKTKFYFFRNAAFVLWALCMVSVVMAQSSDHEQRAKQILNATNVKGGLIVHIGCGNGRLTAALLTSDSYVVHGLDTDIKNVEYAREYIKSRGLYGKVSVDKFDGRHLPYTDNLANLIVAESLDSVPLKEVERVLCPKGIAYIKKKGKWTLTVKPWPEDIDEWTHYLHDASNNAVARDTVVGPPRHMQWVGGPLWARHHEHLSSMNAMVSAGGRLFYIMDEGSRASIQLPPKWKLIARDAFNGTILWKRDILRWYAHNYPLKSGPADLPRRLVATADRVYVPLGIDQPLSALDAATGETVHTFAQSKAAEEVLLANGVLFILVNPGQVPSENFTWDEPICWWVNYKAIHKRAWNQQKRTLLAVEPESGKILWKGEKAVAPVTLAVDNANVLFFDGNRVVCLNRKTGKGKWESEPVGVKESPLPTHFAPTLVSHDSVILFAGGDGKMTAFDAETGTKLWTNRHYRAGHMSPEDILVVGGLVWTGGLAERQKNNVWTGYDLHTGRLKKEFPPDIKSYWFHHRCHRSKATVNFLLPSRTGIEFVDWRRQTWQRHHWVRGACLYGIMPANGLVYAPQHPCACYMETKLNGLNALASSRAATHDVSEAARLEKGPAYGDVSAYSIGFEDWPTYRSDNLRSGFVKTHVSATIKPAWQAEIGGRLSALTIAGDMCFVASIDQQTICALEKRSGRELWRFTAGGRVDSPPTIYNGCAIFGCADGYVYNVRACDGILVWRYLAATGRQRHMAFGQIESLWPVHGSVLVNEGNVYCVAGRSAFLDGGMRFCRIDAGSGRLLSQTQLDHRLPDSGSDLQTVMNGLNMPTALPDILSCDGKNVYMRSQQFDLNGKRGSITAPTDPSAQIGEHVHLFCGSGFLDDSWFHRVYWLYGQTLPSGCNYWFHAGRFTPAGRILVFDNDTVYGYGRQSHYFVWTPALEYRLFASAKKVTAKGIERVRQASTELDSGNTKGPWYESDRWIFNRERTAQLRPSRLSAADERWSLQKPKLIARGMALANKVLFVAGPPDLLDEEAAVSRRSEADVQKQIEEQDAALNGKKGTLLWALSATDGKLLAELELDACPVWDGMAAAGGRLYIATVDGKVLCLAPDK